MALITSKSVGVTVGVGAAGLLALAVLGIGNPWRAGYAEIPTLAGAWGSIASPAAGGRIGVDWLIQCPGEQTDTCLRRAGYLCKAFEEMQNETPVAPIHFERGWGRGGTRLHLTSHIFVSCLHT